MRARSAVALGAGGLLAAQWAPAVAVVSTRVARLVGVPTSLPSERGVLLTFDDGPHPLGTPAVLEELDRARAPAVFFVTGEQATRFPTLVSEIAAAGHEIAVHGDRHQSRRQWTRRLVAEDTMRALDAISRVTAPAPRLYRPPHGVFSLSGLASIRALGLAPLLWSKWGRDWERRATAATIARRATAGIRAGDVVLLHDADHYAVASSWRRTVASLPSILERLRELGLEAARVRPDASGAAGLSLTS